MSKIKTLYHGTTSLFNKIDINEGSGYKDFGPGFYLSGVKQRAINIARRNKEREIEQNEILGIKGTVLSYCYSIEFDESALEDKLLNIKLFKEANIEWMKFILFNRQNKFKEHNFDIVIGATADASTVPIINRYIRKYGKDMNDDILTNLIQELKPEIYPKQYYFGTDAAIKYLKIQLGRRETV